MDITFKLQTPIINLDHLPQETRKVSFCFENGRGFIRCYDQNGTKIGAALYNEQTGRYEVEPERLAWYRNEPVLVETL